MICLFLGFFFGFSVNSLLALIKFEVYGSSKVSWST